MTTMISYDAAIADIARAKVCVERAVTRLSSTEPLGRTSRVLNPRRQILEMLPEILAELGKCEDAYLEMLEGGVLEHTSSRPATFTHLDHQNMDAFLGHVMEDFKSGVITKDQAVGGLARMVAALDVGNYEQVRVWFDRGHKLITLGGPES